MLILFDLLGGAHRADIKLAQLSEPGRPARPLHGRNRIAASTAVLIAAGD